MLVSSTQQRILLTCFIIRPVLCDNYTLRQGLNKIVWGTYFIPKVCSTNDVPIGCEQQKHPQTYVQDVTKILPLGACVMYNYGAHGFNVKSVSPIIIHYTPSGKIFVTSCAYVCECFCCSHPSGTSFVL